MSFIFHHSFCAGPFSALWIKINCKSQCTHLVQHYFHWSGLNIGRVAILYQIYVSFFCYNMQSQGLAELIFMIMIKLTILELRTSFYLLWEASIILITDFLQSPSQTKGRFNSSVPTFIYPDRNLMWVLPNFINFENWSLFVCFFELPSMWNCN